MRMVTENDDVNCGVNFLVTLYTRELLDKTPMQTYTMIHNVEIVKQNIQAFILMQKRQSQDDIVSVKTKNDTVDQHIRQRH